jgi:hypothetical protein
VRKTVGRAKLPIPMLPEHRQLEFEAVKTKIDDRFGLAKDGDLSGTIAHVNLNTSIEADIMYAVKLGHLVAESDGQLRCKNGQALRVQFKMDACRLWSKVQQTAIAYVFVNASTNTNSPYDTV